MLRTRRIFGTQQIPFFPPIIQTAITHNDSISLSITRRAKLPEAMLNGGARSRYLSSEISAKEATWKKWKMMGQGKKKKWPVWTRGARNARLSSWRLPCALLFCVWIFHLIFTQWWKCLRTVAPQSLLTFNERLLLATSSCLPAPRLLFSFFSCVASFRRAISLHFSGHLSQRCLSLRRDQLSPNARCYISPISYSKRIRAISHKRLISM